jgi:dTDP-4-dehydrorhamnose reductase
MKILLLGKNGQLGWELQRTLATLGEIVAMDKNDLNLVDYSKLIHTVQALRPDLIVNAAAYTAVDKAEEEPELAMAINGIVPGILAEEAYKINAALIHFSTDYVFDGTKFIPYTEEDEPKPLNVYGKTKLAGEKAIQAIGGAYLVFRTSWVYGMRGHNFLLTILRLAKEVEELRVVNDQIGAPTWSRIIAEATAQVLVKDAKDTKDTLDFIKKHSGIYHMTASGSTSWYDFSKQILRLANKEQRVCKVLKAIKTIEFPSSATRPKYSIMDNSKFKSTFNIYLPNWRDTLKLVLT